MRDALGEGTTLSYCTNVHAGATLDEAMGQLSRYSTRVRELIDPVEPLDIGLWLPCSVNWMDVWIPLDRAAPGHAASTLERLGLRVPTMNAFPYSNFHAERVKHDVYEPDWGDSARWIYSLYAAESLVMLLRSGETGSVSTLPLGWRRGESSGVWKRSGEHLRDCAERFLQVWHQMPVDGYEGHHVTLDLEPEPGCILDTADDVIEFFDSELPDEIHRNYIGVCHDICHAAVMFEDQVEVLRRYADAGIRVNKIQISSAIEANAASLGPQRTAELLSAFDEPRYLHQTMLHSGTGNQFHEDLPDAIAALESGAAADLARVHFHVPIFLDSLGELGTTQNQIVPAIKAARELHDCKHFEVETYAWNVLPDEHKPADLAEGIARELRWVMDQFEGDPPPEPKNPRA